VSCHQQAVLADAWKLKPNATTCTSCHDDISFENPAPSGKVYHGYNVTPSSPCSVCHIAEGDGIAGISEVHLVPALDPNKLDPTITIVSVTNSGPGQTPTITFKVEVQGAPRNILTAPLNSLRFTFAGPNTDFAKWWQSTAQGSGATGTLEAVDAAAGIFRYTPAAAAAIPANATGSYTLGIEGYIQPTGAPRYAALSAVAPFAVTDPAPVARRKIVDDANCNRCHLDLAGHGGGRKGANYCVLCHGPNDMNDERASRIEDQSQFVHSVDFKVMIHGIHMGEELTQPYILGGNPSPTVANPAGNPVDFGEVRYPSSRTACTMCHAGKTYTLPLVGADSRLPSRNEVHTCIEDPAADTDALCGPSAAASGWPLWPVTETFTMQPAAAACTGCHDAPDVIAHAEVMTTVTGDESCATCHGAGAEWDVELVHGLK
jgi:OmcA/MtrC family decaheme c-type cytochrome